MFVHILLYTEKGKLNPEDQLLSSPYIISGPDTLFCFQNSFNNGHIFILTYFVQPLCKIVAFWRQTETEEIHIHILSVGGVFLQGAGSGV